MLRFFALETLLDVTQVAFFTQPRGSVVLNAKQLRLTVEYTVNSHSTTHVTASFYSPSRPKFHSLFQMGTWVPTVQ